MASASKGFGRSTSVEAEAVSADLRRGDDGWLRRRRNVAALSLSAMGSMGVVAAYQFGLLRRPPEPRIRLLDAQKVDASGEAYQFLKTPDAAVGLASYAATLALAGMGDRNRARTRPWVPLALAAKVGLDAVSGVLLTAEQASKHRRFCSWCLAASAASVAMVPQVLPEAREAWHRLRRG
ncbi:MAG: vitamin K epoxide reductase family protein [Acidimicrobiia bacterium]